MERRNEEEKEGNVKKKGNIVGSKEKGKNRNVIN